MSLAALLHLIPTRIALLQLTTHLQVCSRKYNTGEERPTAAFALARTIGINH